MTVSEYLLDYPGPIHFDWSSGSNKLSFDIVDLKARLWWDPDRKMKDGSNYEFPGCSGWGTDYSNKPVLEFGVRNLSTTPATYNPRSSQSKYLEGAAYKWVSGDTALQGSTLQQRDGEIYDPTNPYSHKITLSAGNVGILYGGQYLTAYTETAAGDVTEWNKGQIAVNSSSSCLYASSNYWNSSIIGIRDATNNNVPVFSLAGTTQHSSTYPNYVVLNDNYHRVYILPTATKSAVNRASGYAPVGGGAPFDTIITKDGDRWIAHNADGTVDILTRRSRYLTQFAYSTNPASPIEHLETGTPLARCVTANGVFWGRWNGFAYRDFRSEGQ